MTRRYTMQVLRIGSIGEPDFDLIIQRAGGKRLVKDDSVQDAPNADYLLGNTVIELKMVEEEGLDKDNRRRKIAELFARNQPDRPVVVLAPELLDDPGLRAYYRALEGPIKTAVKTAAKQLDNSATAIGGVPCRVLVAINTGYTALDHAEFKEVARKCCKNNTSKIDVLVVGGIYHHSDGFDSYTFFPFEQVPINLEQEFLEYLLLSEEWGRSAEELMTAVVHGDPSQIFDKMPVMDIKFELDGVTCVKPSPRFGQPSDFWGEKRPRENSTGITTCPLVAQTFPDMDSANWKRIQAAIHTPGFFRDTYAAWVEFRNGEESHLGSSLRPFVAVPVNAELYHDHCDAHGEPPSVRSLCQFAVDLFEERLRRELNGMRPRTEARVVPATYVLLLTQEIGRDQADDLASILLIRETDSGTQKSVLVRHARIFFEHAQALAAAYAVKFDCVALFERDRSFVWE